MAVDAIAVECHKAYRAGTMCTLGTSIGDWEFVSHK